MAARSSWILVALAFAAVAALADDPPVLHPGETLRLEMPKGDPEKTAVRLQLAATENGPLTIETSTLYFDALLKVFAVDAAGDAKPLAEDDDGGVGGASGNSRLTFEAAAEGNYRVEVRANQDEWGGPIEVSAVRGTPPALDAVALRKRDTAYWEAVAAEGERTGSAILESRALTGRGLLHSQAGEYAASRPLYERALAIDEKVHGPGHSYTATSLNNLAGLLQDMGEYAAARPLFERALAIREKVHGPEHPETATSLHRLASLLQAMGEHAAARPLYERALAIYEKVHGPEHPYTATSLNNLAALLQDMGEHAAARPLSERALAIREKVHGPEHPETAAGLNNLAVLLQAMGEYAAARPLNERALAIREKVHGPEHPETAGSLNNLAGLLGATGEYAAARPLFERALAIRETVQGPEHPETATSLISLAVLLYAMGEYAAARPLFERALAIYERVHGPEHPYTATSLNNLAALLQAMGGYAAARPLYERALAIQEKVHGPEHPETGGGLNNLAVLLQAMGEYAASRPLFERSLAIDEKVYGPEHPETATSLNNLASLLQDMGEYASARPLVERALAIFEKVHGPEHPATATGLHNLALLLQDMGEYAAARPLYERALAIDERLQGPEHPATATSLNSLASLFQATGEYAAARPLFERALAIREKVQGPEHPETATSLDSLASLLQAMSKYAASRSLFERALAIREKVNGAEHPVTATGLHNLALLLQDMGEYAAARPMYERALAIDERVHGPEHPETAASLNNLARLLQAMGEYAASRLLFERALAIREKALGSEHPDTGRSLLGLAKSYQALGEVLPALEAALRAESIGAAHLAKTARAMSEEAALRYAATRARGLDLALSLLATGGDSVAGSAGKVWAAVVASRGLVLDEVASRHRRGMATVRAARELGDSSEALAKLMVRGASGTEIERARSRKERAERQLARATETVSAAPAPPGLEQVGLGLPPDGALVAFVRYDRPRGGGVAGPDGKADQTTVSYLAFVLQKGARAPVVVSLGDARPIDALVEAWKREAGSGARGESAEASYRTAGESLRRAVWDPLSGAIAAARRLFVVPDGALHLVSLAALPAADSSYLIESGPWIQYLSSERDLVAEPGGAPASSAGLLAVGGPSFDSASGSETQGALVASAAAFRGSRSASADFRGLRFEPLPGTRAEAAEIVRLWRERERPSYVQATASRETQQVEPAELLEGAAANETVFKERAPGHRVLHLATHGFFLGGEGGAEPESKRGIGALAATPPPGAKLENPLLLSGLALAGANQREQAGADEDDGILTAEEIASLDLSGVEWAVLSACDTGVGDVRAGEGVFGLRRAFRVAGAGTLILSLWSVDDDATRQWMSALYDARLNKRMSTAESVREAGLSVLRSRRASGQSTHPFYWGAFVAAGDWK